MNWLDKTIVALDDFNPVAAEKIMDQYATLVYGFKMNHTLFPHTIKNGLRIFADYKLYDIPKTMCSVVEHLIAHEAEMVTINMMNCRNSLSHLTQYKDDIKLLGVSVLTSWNEVDTYEMYHKTISDVYLETIPKMLEFGFWGMICAPVDLEYPTVQSADLRKICPGIRQVSFDEDDQVRIATPETALSNGADLLVMGRSFFSEIEKS
jgi:orotidine-5'-phosphate decarboxylase